jgi:hypothetical protein
MSKFIRPEIIRDAISRLVESRAKSGMTDFLILKRALARSASDTVPFSMNDQDFTAAIYDLAGTAKNDSSDAGILPGPFIKVFGTADVEKKYVSRKMLTNGPADTLSGPSWRGVVRIAGSHPRSGGLQKGHENRLADLLLKSGGSKPYLTDAAIWFYRATDLETKLTTVSADANTLFQSLRDSFVKELGLTKKETGVLFDGSELSIASPPAEGWLQEEAPNPAEYLPDLEASTASANNGALGETVGRFVADASSEAVGLEVEQFLVLRMSSALLAKRFLLLSGLAGSGKTKLAQAFARWLTPSQTPNPRYVLIPVGADWTGNENILGYPDGLDAQRYVTKPALELLLHAAKEEEREDPHFLLLDEMNLSHVERYFADLLSAIESGEAIPLYEDGDRAADLQAIPRKLTLPPNVFIIGTVNVDETTYMFSPKVLDRANVIEFHSHPTENVKKWLEA